MRLGPPAEDDANALLDRTAPDLPVQLRRRVLAEAHGNPLALTELPTAAADLADSVPTLPLTERLERAFSARGAALPERTRSALLVAALDDGDSVGETLAATGILVGSAVGTEILAPAMAAKMSSVDASQSNVVARCRRSRSSKGVIPATTSATTAVAGCMIANLLRGYDAVRQTGFGG